MKRNILLNFPQKLFDLNDFTINTEKEIENIFSKTQTETFGKTF
jgi:hypothetical protein